MTPSPTSAKVALSIVLLLIRPGEAGHHHGHHHRHADRRFLGPQRRRHHHHRQHHHDLAALTTSGVSVYEDALDLDADAPQTQDANSRLQPLVGDNVNAVGHALQELRDDQGQTDSIRERLQHTEQTAFQGMSHGLAFRRVMASAKASAHDQDEALTRLQGQESRLQREHESVERKLETMKGPRIAAAEHRLEKRRQAVAKLEAKRERLDRLRSKYKVAAVQRVKDRRSTSAALTEIEDAVKELAQREHVARERYDRARREVEEAVEAYQQMQVRYEAMQTKTAEQSEKVEQAEASVGETRRVFEVEGFRIDRAWNASEAKLVKRIQVAKSQREKARLKFRAAKERLHNWQAGQEKLESTVVELKKDYENHEKNDAESQQKDLGGQRDGPQSDAESEVDEGEADSTPTDDVAADDGENEDTSPFD